MTLESANLIAVHQHVHASCSSCLSALNDHSNNPPTTSIMFVKRHLPLCLAFRYQQIATAAYDVVCQQQQQQQTLSEGQPGTLQQQQQGKPAIHPALVGAAAGPWPANSSSSSSKAATLQGTPAATAAAAPSAAVGGMMQVLEGTAQEVFRVLLFLVFTLEVFLVSLLPLVGEAAAAYSTLANVGIVGSGRSRVCGRVLNSHI
jgi:hypothetical protein